MTNNELAGTFNVLISLVYVVDYSLIHQIFSNRKNSKIFSLQLNDENNKFELIVYKCIHEIETRGLREPFIYELDTCLTDIKWAILQLERDFFTILQHLPDINAVASKNSKACYSFKVEKFYNFFLKMF